MSKMQEIQQQLVEDFGFLEDWEDKYAYLIDLGKSLTPLNEQYKNEHYLIKGCQSKVWLHAELQGNIIRYFADSDAFISKGIVALLVKVFDGQKPEEVLHGDFFVIDRIGLANHLSPNRANGLGSMLKQMRVYAMAFQTKIQNA
ncbi:MAG: SufE family protein [Bacteroidia bacterium]